MLVRLPATIARQNSGKSLIENFELLEYADKPTHLFVMSVLLSVEVDQHLDLCRDPDHDPVEAFGAPQTETYLFCERPFSQPLINREDGPLIDVP